MRKILAVLVLTLLCTTGFASGNGNFYLISGPQFAGTPAPYSGVFKGNLYQPKSVSAVLLNGEKFEGKWVSTSPGKVRYADHPVPAVVEPKLASAWDSVYGQGFFTAHVVGAPFFARAEVKGSKGTVLQVEIYRRFTDGQATPPYPALDLQGVAQDSSGNIYKVVF